VGLPGLARELRLRAGASLPPAERRAAAAAGAAAAGWGSPRTWRMRAGPRRRPTRARARARRLTTEIMIEEIGRRPGGGGGGGAGDGDGGAPRNNADAAGATGAVAQVTHQKKGV